MGTDKLEKPVLCSLNSVNIAFAVKAMINTKHKLKEKSWMNGAESAGTKCSGQRKRERFE